MHIMLLDKLLSRFSSNGTVDSFLDRYEISEPTRSLLWITEEDTSKIISSRNIIINVKIDLAAKKVVTSDSNGGSVDNIDREPSLIWIKLPVEKSNYDEKANFYADSYAELNPRQRYHYLEWLKDITHATNFRYVSIYFKGLERHLFLGDYDGAVKELVRLWNSQNNLEIIKSDIVRSLTHASVLRERMDVFTRAPFLHKYATNSGFYIQKVNKIPLNAIQVMDAAYDVGFDKIYQIRKWKDTIPFQLELQKRIEHFEEENGAILDFIQPEQSEGPSYSRINNSSIPQESVRINIPHFVGNYTLKFIFFTLLSDAYAEVKGITKRKPGSVKKITTSHKRKSPRVSESLIAREGSISKENLPFPYVYYSHTFLGFKKDLLGQLYFCSCAKKAIQNYIRLQIEYPQGAYLEQTKNFMLSSRDFPVEFVKKIMRENPRRDSSIFELIPFFDNLCHECNKATPSLLYTLPMYGGLFVQKYGWYTNKMSYELGIQSSFFGKFLPDVCPKELVGLINERDTVLEQLSRESKNDPNQSGIFGIQTELSKRARIINNAIQNYVREKFGHKKVGEAWTGETILYYLVKNIFPEFTVIHHFRPEYLKGMEFDIYVQELQLAIEYQGIQHFYPVEHWGGDESLQKLQERDKRKHEIAIQQGVKIVYFNYDDNLTEGFVSKRLRE